jgi:hypothetical protein
MYDTAEELICEEQRIPAMRVVAGAARPVIAGYTPALSAGM